MVVLMRKRLAMFSGVLVALALLSPLRSDAASTRFKNCTLLNAVYPYGVGLPEGIDRVRGRTAPVTNFERNRELYLSQPRTLDRDKDGIACEKRPL